MTDASDEAVARVAHAANRAWCEAHGDATQPAWDDAPAWQRESLLRAVAWRRRNPGRPPEEVHERWLLDREAEGWTYGEEKDPVAGTHPCMVPWNGLTDAQKAKDALFGAVVDALCSR